MSRVPGVALVAVLLLAACGGGTATPGASTATPGATTAPPLATGPTGTAAGAPASGKAACDLLGDEELRDITGFAVTDENPAPADTVYANVCRWNLQTGEITLGILETDATSRFDRTVESEGATELSGLGDRAVRTSMTNSLLVLSGGTMIDIFAIGVDDAIEEQLAARVLANLRG